MFGVYILSTDSRHSYGYQMHSSSRRLVPLFVYDRLHIRTTQLTSTPFGRVVHNSEETISHFLYFSLKFKGAQIKAEPTKDGAKGTHESLMIVDSYIHKC
jgi:hypothetical protein